MVSILSMVGTILLISLICIASPKHLIEAQLLERDGNLGGDKSGYYLLDDGNNIGNDLSGILGNKEQLAAKLLEDLAEANYNQDRDSNYINGPLRDGSYYSVGSDQNPAEQSLGYLVSGLNGNNNGITGPAADEEYKNRAFLMRRASYDPMDDPISPPINDPLDAQRLVVDADAPVRAALNNMSYISPEQRQQLDLLLNSNRYPLLIGVDNGNILDTNAKTSLNKQPNSISSGDLFSKTASQGQHYQDSEYIDHPLAIVGHQYVQGGAGEGRQLLGPDGTFENVQVIKSDHASSSYCNPPNPCPIGYTEKDGCLEKFVNSASFSREYQAKQDCSCDNEHSLFNCAAPITTQQTTDNNNIIASGISLITTNGADEDDDDNGITQDNGTTGDNDGNPNKNIGHMDDDMDVATLARAIKNRFGDLDAVKDLVSKERSHQSMD